MDDPVAEAQLLDYWRYDHDGQSFGPVSGEEINSMLRTRQLPPTILVWREGMDQFMQVTAFAGLIQGVKVPMKQILDPHARRQAQILNNAKQNSLAMFVILLLWVMALSVEMVAVVSGGSGTGSGISCFASAGVLGGIYAAIYLPLRWKTIMKLPQHYRVMGLIGGVGLIALLVLTFVGSIAVATLGV